MTGSAPVRAGTACSIEANLAPYRGGIGAEDVRVTCGTSAIYDSNVRTGGMYMQSAAADQNAAPTGAGHVYRLAYEDTGARWGGAAQIAFSSNKRSGALWSEGESPYRITLQIEEDSAVSPTSILSGS